jgi:hypothetical protein
MIEFNEGEFSVVQWFPNGVYEYVRRNVDAQAAMDAAKHYCTCVGAKMGTTVRVMIEDGGGYCVFEWEREQGVTFPPEVAKGQWRHGIN